MVTIKEMAQELGVSTTTVSNVIHGKTKEVSPANIERIQKILKKYDYIITGYKRYFCSCS